MVRKKQGVSLIVLVITIIVMIILASAIIISLSNTGIINQAHQAVDDSNIDEIQHLASLAWSEEYTKQLDNERINTAQLYNAVVTALEKENIDTDKYDIAVNSKGVLVTVKPLQGMLGDLITNPKTDYGKLVDYTVTVDGETYNEWQVYYEDEEHDYVFLIAKEPVDFVAPSELKDVNGNSSIEVSDLSTAQLNLYNIFKLGKPGFDITKGQHNSDGVAALIMSYGDFAKTEESYKSDVIGSIGGPTIELLAAGYNAKHGVEAIVPIVDTSYYDYEGERENYIPEYDGGAGYFLNAKGQEVLGNLIKDGVYVSEKVGEYSYGTWLTSPSAGADADVGWRNLLVVYATSGNTTGQITYAEPNYYKSDVRPVVCLKSSVMAKATADGYSLITAE